MKKRLTTKSSELMTVLDDMLLVHTVTQTYIYLKYGPRSFRVVAARFWKTPVISSQVH